MAVLFYSDIAAAAGLPDTRELAEGPGADGADIDMHELRDRIEAGSVGMEGQGGVAQSAGADVDHSNGASAQVPFPAILTGSGCHDFILRGNT